MYVVKYRERRNELRRLRYHLNREKELLTVKTWQANNQETVKKARKNRWIRIEKPELETRPEKKVLKSLRNRLNKTVKFKYANTLGLLGCSLDQFLGSLEIQFQDSMTWENYGDWHIDHKRPCDSFNLLNSEEQKECFHYTNLQPLWASENISKGAKWK